MNFFNMFRARPDSLQSGPSDDMSTPADLVFDDESIESVLYAQTPAPPTPASIFGPARSLLNTLTSNSNDAKSEAAMQTYVRYLDDGYPVSNELFASLLNIGASFLPEWPKPMLPDMPPSVGPLMERLWRYANGRDDDDLRHVTGSKLWQWYEYVGRHADARSVLAGLEVSYERRRQKAELPGVINNFAFQFLKEGSWNEAAVHFDRAANLASALKQTADYANARANYWGCRFELEGVGICELMAPELRRLGEILAEERWLSGYRKVLVLLGRVEAALGRPMDGVPLLERAVAIDESQGSMYLERDSKLLAALRAQAAET